MIGGNMLGFFRRRGDERPSGEVIGLVLTIKNDEPTKEVFLEIC